MKRELAWLVVAAALSVFGFLSARAGVATTNFFNFETAPVHPVALSPDGAKLAVCNLPYGHVELFDVTSGAPVSIAAIPVGLDPVSVSFLGTNQLWVANYVSGTISIVDLPSFRVLNTIVTSNQPSDIVFAGSPPNAFVTCGAPNLVEVFDPQSFLWKTNLVIDGNRPRAMAVSPDGSTVYVAVFESGNASTIISSGVAELANLPKPNAVNYPMAPSGGLNPPPNSGSKFVPAINPVFSNSPPPRVGLIVKKNPAGRWMDDSQGDWTEFIRGTNAALTGRVPGWDMPDHDLAVINTTDLSIAYASGLMNICMAVGVNPATGKITVVGTDALNQTRFQPVLESVFIRVNLAQVDPVALTNTVTDLNPHLDYQTRQVSSNQVMMSIGDPRGIVWTSDGTRGYVTGMGSDNLVVINAQGGRVGTNAVINVGQGPTGLALDESRNRLYIYNRFDDSVSTVDTVAQTVLETLPLFDPTPLVIKAGRPFLYNTHLTSGLGQLSCASCHVDARFDRIAWDLGDPTDVVGVIGTNYNFATAPAVTNNFHPMKGPMMTLTLQDIIGHEPFHWRGDREGLEAFAVTFTNLQGMPVGISTNQMAQLKGFLATVGFGPNPFRPMDNSLPISLGLPGQLALGRGKLPFGAQLPNGNAQFGQSDFRSGALGCILCHTQPTGLGTDSQFNGAQWNELLASTNGSHHAALVASERTSVLPFKIPSLRNLPDKMGMNLETTNSRSGFGFFNDGGVDTLTRFIQDGFGVTDDQGTADLIAFLFSFTGSDLIPGSPTNVNISPGLAALDTPAGVGRQITLNNPADASRVNTIDGMIGLAGSASGRVDLVVKGMQTGVARGWYYDSGTGLFRSDRSSESLSPPGLRVMAAVGAEQTYMLVPRGSGRRIGIDRDLDGHLDGDLFLLPPANVSNSITVAWNSVVGLVYKLQYTDDLSSADWTTLPGMVSGTGNVVSETDNTFTTAQARYYRVTTVEP